MSKFLKFIKSNLDEPVLTVKNKKDQMLGMMYYYPKWKKYVWDFEGTVFDAECLSDIVKKLKEMENHT